MDWSRKRFVDFKAGKTQLVLFNRTNNCGAINAKKVGFTPSFFKILGLTFSSKLNRVSYMISTPETGSKKFGAFILLRSSFHLRLLLTFKKLPHDSGWNSVIMSGLVLENGTWVCCIKYKNGYLGLLVLRLLLS